MEASQQLTAASPEFARVFAEHVTIRNFRGISKCAVSLDPELTVLVGPNNAGKSRVLRAIALVLGAAAPERDDLSANTSLAAEIDVVVAPRSKGPDDVFGQREGRRIGSAVQIISDEPVVERFAWRLTIEPEAEGASVRSTYSLLLYDQTRGEWVSPTSPSSASADRRRLISADVVPTGRDIVDDLGRRGSPIRRVLEDLQVAEADRVELEAALGELGDEIVSKSATIASVAESLGRLEGTIDGLGRSEVRALPARIEELARMVSVDVDTGHGGLPVRFHGAGTRSLASIQVQGVLYERRLDSQSDDLRPHPVSLVEEPEAHLHPQAQFEIPVMLSRTGGQVIASTHSTHLITVLEPSSLRVLRRGQNGNPVLYDFAPVAVPSAETPRARRPKFHLDEMEKLRTLVERPFGELVFATAIVIGDGATERAFLPAVLRSAIGAKAHGVCVVDPESLGGPHAVAVAKFARFMDLPWFVFADKDRDGIEGVKNLLSAAGEADESRVVWVRAASADEPSRKNATEQMLLDFDSEMCAAACRTVGLALAESATDDVILAAMTKKKGSLGRVLALEFIERHPWDEADPDCWPAALIQLVKKLMAAPERATS